MPYCGDSTIVKRSPGQREARPLLCRSWSCSDCAPRRRRRLIAEAHGGNPTAFLTLTSRRQPGQTPADAAQALSHAWRKLRLRAMRHYKLDKLPFIAVFEKTILGWPHLHILLRATWLDQRWLSAQMDELLQSPVVWIRRIKSKERSRAIAQSIVARLEHSSERRKGTGSRRTTSNAKIGSASHH